MDKKMMAVIVVAVLVVAGAATAFVLLNNKDNGATYTENAYDMLARVNAEGSGIYIKPSEVVMDGDIPTRNGVAFYNIVDGRYTVTEANKAAWAGLKFGTPGTTSIQHIQICTLADQMGLDMVSVASTAGSDPAKSIYYHEKINNYTAAVDVKNGIDGGILWEPQYAKIVASSMYQPLALTNDLFPDHTCCTIIGNHNFINENSDVTVRFLAAYVDAVKYVQKALEKDGSGNYKNTTEYNNLVSICVANTNGLTEPEIKAALQTITYLYADDETGSLSKLNGDIKSLADNLDNLGETTKSVNSEKLANAFVNDSFLKQAVGYKYTGTDVATVKVAVIDGDIHQIAIRVATANGYFANYGIDVVVSTGLLNGGNVADALIGHQAVFGFIGAPPATLKTINGGFIQV